MSDECREARWIERMTRVVPVLAMVLLIASCGAPFMQNPGISLSGQVEDESGNLLDSVSLDARHSRFDLTAESFRSSREEHQDLGDGRFRFSCSRCSSVRMHFSRPGFYSETLDFRVEIDETSTDPPDGPARPLVLDNVRVVLRSSANAVRLVRYSGTAETDADGPLRVVALRRDLGSRGVALDRLDQEPSRQAGFLPGYIRLLAPTANDGTLAARPLPEVPGARMRFPAAATLDFSTADGGVQLHAIEEGNQAQVYRAMREAPLDGYEPTLAIDTGERSGTYYFYFRTGDYYGKGHVVVPSFGHSDEGVEVVMAHVELRVNPDGDRNLETAR